MESEKIDIQKINENEIINLPEINHNELKGSINDKKSDLNKKNKKKKKKQEIKKVENTIPTENQEESKNESTFEEELNWCIEQIKAGMKDNRLDKFQMKESLSVLNILESETTPFVRKRHLMKVVFGDYRKHMKKK